LSSSIRNLGVIVKQERKRIYPILAPKVFWTAVAERSGDTALDFFPNIHLLKMASDPKRCRRCALPPQSKRWANFEGMSSCA